MTTQTLAILAVMLSAPERSWYGLELCKEAGLAPGSIYAILSRLLKAELLDREWEDIDPAVEGRPRRRLYRLTAAGEAVARREVQSQLAALAPAVPGRWSPGAQPA